MTHFFSYDDNGATFFNCPHEMMSETERVEDCYVYEGELDEDNYDDSADDYRETNVLKWLEKDPETLRRGIAHVMGMMNAKHTGRRLPDSDEEEEEEQELYYMNKHTGDIIQIIPYVKNTELSDAENSIAEQNRYIGYAPYAHNIVSMALGEIARKEGRNIANSMIRKYGLNKKGWNEQSS
jgi:hypothetical protein